MESSHMVIFSTSGKFIMKFNVLHCISLSETLFWTGARECQKSLSKKIKTITLKDQNSQHFNEDLFAVHASPFSFVLYFKAIN